MVNPIVVTPDNVTRLENDLPSDNATLRLETVMVKFGNLVIEVPSAFAKYFPKA